MSDEARVRTLLHDYAREAPTPDFASDLWDRGREHRKKGLRYASLGAVVAATALAVLAYAALDSNITTHSMPAGPSQPSPSVTNASTAMLLPDGSLQAGRYAFKTGVPHFDASYRVTMDVPSGYEGSGNFVIFKGPGQGLSIWLVGDVYAKPCHSSGTLLDPPAASSVHGLVAALENQRHRHASMPTNVTLDGFSGKYLEMTVPAGVNLADCDHGEFRTWVHPRGGQRSLEPGQRDLLWIVNVDGVPLVIDAALGPKSTDRDRAERTQIVESAQIERL
jgi:hypothetical protein